MKKLIITSAVLVIIIILISIYVRHWRAINDLNISLQDSTFIEELPPLPPPPMLYGFIEDSFHIEHGSVRRNQNLASILLANDVDYSTIHNLAENSRDLFDVRRIRAGNPYTVFFSPDSLRNPEWFVYEINNTDYLVMQLTDSLKIYRDKKPIRTVRKSGAGVLNSSLWNAMRANNLNPMLAIEMSEIYAWTVDFFGIERGDNFRILYDETYVDTVSVGISEVYAAHFVHKGRDFFAFRYKEDSVWSYFDEEGNSLRKAFLKAPLNFSRISSRFSNNRFHPVLRIYRPHHGVDYAAPAGTPVYAIGDGTIVARGWDNRGGGNFVRIRHNSVYTTVYMHLQGFARGLHKGQHVQQGQLIGYVGQTGLATGPHLDFRVFQNGQPVDPLSIEAPPVDPISEENMERYLEYIRPLMDELRQIPLSMASDQ
ncbi:M23 family metallopeptidase [Alkalitalea saponilacus]|uniref:Murein DD-endopeptidase MepM and murein hydrolase activator NlpD, contain LysM domain n=1 Tax=Alkalitalea saponilacus TaxID=889453 RepID=A0A1T5BR06_9BACT|nr:peptidoglycan DD-metalloendopeptidase family protein [Alkalitalea saponilacus]ASB49621.1 metalloendopeptidase [Alkalitalea saponilacus]SKB49688.1 Murein DD-endopeptidase MepM and murein hydrolase activator NlpD, contain LysM domain [Alkalitalea saponilacus]